MISDDWLQHLERSSWLTHRPTRLVRCVPAGDGRWSLGPVTVDQSTLLAAQPPGPPGLVREFRLLHQGWRVESFRLFRPLVYFAAFSAPQIFECLALSVGSLLHHGGWEWEVLVLTGRETVDTVHWVLASLGLGPRLHVAAVETAATPLDWCLARYRLDAHPVMMAAQPLLYLDTDIVCDRPLLPLLSQLPASPVIHACAEGMLGEGSPDGPGHWFGWRMLSEDGVPFDPKGPGFNSGALGMASADIAGPAFSLILAGAYADAARSDGGRRLAGLDQPFANYVLRKLGLAELGLMPRVLNLHRLDVGGLRIPDPAKARGLVHVLGAPLAVKLSAMQAYVAALEG